ncbi:hypothetical protein PIB30_109226, partial [Stylosanthes scabra]|nr:hypothetical protein [Stylosanthes scabra]
MRTRVGRNDEGDRGVGNATLSVFNQPGDLGGRKQSRRLTFRELDSAHLHILLNCPEVDEIR